MSSFLSLFSLSHISHELSRTLRRFTLSSVCIMIVTVTLLYLVHQSYGVDDDMTDMIGRIAITGVVIFFLATATTLALEAYTGKRMLLRVISWILIAVFAWGFYSAIGSDPFDSIDDVTRIFLTFFCFFAFLFVSPFLVKWRAYKESGYGEYFTSMAGIILMSGVVGGAVMALGAIALASVDALFDVMWVESDTYSSLAVMAFACFAPLFGLARIPSEQDIIAGKARENVFFNFLVKYIGLPFIGLYFLILYAYSVKVLINFSDWPNGQVAWMVIGFSVFGYVIYIFSHALAQSIPLIASFRRYFPFLVLPQVAMLFYAISLRIMQYDLTINRYFVVVFGLWLTGISLYYAFAKNTRLIIIPTSLAILSLIISVGPWSVYQYPLERQYDRLIQNLEAANIYKDGVVTPLEKYDSIDPKLSQEIYEGIGYLCDFDNCRQIRELFAQEISQAEAEKKTRWEASEAKYQKCMDEAPSTGVCYREEYSKSINRYEFQSIITDKIQVRYAGYSPDSIPPTIGFTLSTLYPLDISGYDSMYQVGGAGLYTNNRLNQGVVLDFDTHSGKILIGGEVVDVFSTTELEASLILRIKDPYTSSYSLTKDDMTYTLSGVKYDVRLIFQSLTIKNPSYTGKIEYFYNNADGYALIRKK